MGKKLEGKIIFFCKNRSDAVRFYIERREHGYEFVVYAIEFDLFLLSSIERRGSIFFSFRFFFSRKTALSLEV